jgi:hypothetical protein
VVTAYLIFLALLVATFTAVLVRIIHVARTDKSNLASENQTTLPETRQTHGRENATVGPPQVPEVATVARALKTPDGVVRIVQSAEGQVFTLVQSPSPAAFEWPEEVLKTLAETDRLTNEIRNSGAHLARLDLPQADLETSASRAIETIRRLEKIHKTQTDLLQTHGFVLTAESVDVKEVLARASSPLTPGPTSPKDDA